MATVTRKATAKTAALASTAVVSLRPVGGSLDDKAIHAQMSLAFADQERGIKFAGSAVQRGAYACMALFNRAARQEIMIGGIKLDVGLAKLATSKDAMADAFPLVRRYFVGDAPSTANNKRLGDREAMDGQVYSRQTAMLKRALRLASVLAGMNIGLAAFNDKVGNWTVESNRLFAKDVTPIGDLSKKTVLLDGRTYGGMGKNKKGEPAFTKVTASVEQLIMVALPTVARNATAAGQGASEAVDLKKINGAALANGAPYDVILAAFYQLFVKDAPKDAKLSDQSPANRNMLTAIVQQYDAMRNADAAATNAA